MNEKLTPMQTQIAGTEGSYRKQSQYAIENDPATAAEAAANWGSVPDVDHAQKLLAAGHPAMQIEAGTPSVAQLDAEKAAEDAMRAQSLPTDVKLGHLG